MQEKCPLEQLCDAQTWIFDLDNTLYCPSSGILEQVERAMTRYLSEALNISGEAANQLRSDYRDRYGATLDGLTRHHDIDRDAFLHAAHDIDISRLIPNPELMDAIEALPVRRIIHTNSPRRHAERLLRQLNLNDMFETIYALEDVGFRPKPQEPSFAHVLSDAKIEPRKTIMVEDSLNNMVTPKRLGMKTIWARNGVKANRPTHVDVATDNLPKLLAKVAAKKRVARL